MRRGSGFDSRFLTVGSYFFDFPLKPSKPAPIDKLQSVRRPGI